MRDKKWFARADWILWSILSLAPLISYFFTCYGSDTLVTFNTYISGWGFDVSSNPLGRPFLGIFGSAGVFPFLHDNSGLYYFMLYFINIHVIHLFVDFILFIPRLAHKFMDGLLGGD